VATIKPIYDGIPIGLSRAAISINWVVDAFEKGITNVRTHGIFHVGNPE
jgi:hypothetical protein